MNRKPTFFDYVCSNADKFAILLALECLAFVLSLGLFFVSEPGTATRVVGVLNLVGLVVLGLGTSAILLKCHRM